MNYKCNQKKSVVRQWLDDVSDARVREHTRGMYSPAKQTREQVRRRIEQQLNERYKKHDDI